MRLAETNAAFESALEELTSEKPQIFTCSAETGAGRADLLKFIGSLL